jgi:hypothetical protein
MRLKKTAIIRESTSLTVLLKELTREVGMSKSIPVFISKKCQTPFASGIFFTKILGPEDFEGWPKEQLRVVLLHELAHIKRQDLFTQCISRLICSIFWFLPFLWLCYSHLRIEQEKSCDVMTIGTGLNPADFATHLIGLVRHMKAHAYASAVFIFNGRKKMIEKRVVNALQLKCWTHQNKKAIRYVLSIFLICLAGLLIINPVSAEDVAGSLDQKEMLCGTWINTDYNTRAEAAKIILNPDGSYYFFAKISSKTRLWGVSYLIEDAWTDADQNTWYKMRTDCLEFVYHTHKSDEYPTSIPEDHPNYRIYYKLQ